MTQVKCSKALQFPDARRNRAESIVCQYQHGDPGIIPNRTGTGGEILLPKVQNLIRILSSLSAH
jgi:hypothetical protein